MRAVNRILLLWLVATVALSFNEASCRALAGSDDVQSNSTDVKHDEENLESDLNETSIPEVCNDPSASRWMGDNLSEVLSAWNFTPEEEASLFALGDRLADIDHWKNDPAEVARFIKEHNFDVDKAERMFRGMIQWRMENKIDDFMEKYGEPPEIFRYVPLFLLKGLDKDGDPIFVLRIGSLDAWGLYQRLGEKAMLEANRFVSEIHTSRDVGIPEGWRWQKEYYEPLTGRRVTQFTILVDLDGLSPRLLRPAMFSFLQTTARIAQDHYPRLAKRMIFFRAPRLFKMAWKVAKHFYDSRVHHKFVFTNHDDYTTVLSEYLDLDVLPSVMYPKGSGTQMPGFFEKIHMEGGLIPDDDSIKAAIQEDPASEEVPPSVAPEMATTS